MLILLFIDRSNKNVKKKKKKEIQYNFCRNYMDILQQASLIEPGYYSESDPHGLIFYEK